MSAMAAARLHGADFRFEIDKLDRDAIRFRSGDLAESARFFRDGDQLYIMRQGATFSVHDLTKSAPASAAASSSDGRLRAAMNGRVVAVWSSRESALSPVSRSLRWRP